MIDAQIVTDWKRKTRVPGLVERGACEILRDLASAVPEDQAIVELGSYKGRSTGWLLLGAQDGHGAHVTAVDPWGKRRGKYVGGGNTERFRQAEGSFRSHMARIGATDKELTVINDYGEDAGKLWTGPEVGLLWHDAGHGAVEVAEDLKAWLPHMADEAVIVLHDVCRPEYGVVEGAKSVLEPDDDWNWRFRKVVPWSCNPNKRGIMIVRTKKNRASKAQ